MKLNQTSNLFSWMMKKWMSHEEDAKTRGVIKIKHFVLKQPLGGSSLLHALLLLLLLLLLVVVVVVVVLPRNVFARIIQYIVVVHILYTYFSIYIHICVY